MTVLSSFAKLSRLLRESHVTVGLQDSGHFVLLYLHRIYGLAGLTNDDVALIQ